LLTASSLALASLVLSNFVLSNHVLTNFVRTSLVRTTLAVQELPQTEEQPLAAQRNLNLTEAQLQGVSASRWSGAAAELEPQTWAVEQPEVLAQWVRTEH
jgi:hypothetical protein